MQLDEILENMPDGMFIIDTNLTIKYANKAFYKLLKFEEGEIIGTSITEFLGDLSILDSCMSSVNEIGHCDDQETIFIQKDGSHIHISKNVQAIYNHEHQITEILVSIRDLTKTHQLNKELLESEEDLKRLNEHLESLVNERTSELSYRLYFNTLTGLPNRRKLLNTLDDIKDESHALILFNIDQFNELNSLYGNRIADVLLKQIAFFLTSISSHFSNAQVFKLPVDEFAILIRSPFTEKEIELFIHLLFQKIQNEIFTVEEQLIQINATAGIACSKISSEDQNLLSQANLAHKEAKLLRKNHTFYSSQNRLNEDYANTLLWIKKLREAIEHDLIVPYFQPIVDIKTKEVKHYEALVRIVEKNGTVITPDAFLEISKKVRLYHHITTIMVNKVFQLLENNPHIECSVNLSIEDIDNEQTHRFLVNKIRHANCSNRVTFEIIESEGIRNYQLINDFIHQVKQYGAKIALDDFGAGYSNFAYITQLDIDMIKIDGSIIKDIVTNSKSQIIAKTLIDFANQLGAKTVAEYVSSEEISDYLQTFELDFVQGYHYGHPSPDIL